MVARPDSDASSNVEEVMTTSVVTVSPDDTLERIIDIFAEIGFHHVLVAEENKLKGVISDRDILQNLSPYVGRASELPRDTRTLSTPARQIMVRDAVTIHRKESATGAAALLLKSRISCLPVVDSDQLIQGIVTWRDILQHLVRLPRDSVLQPPGSSKDRKFHRTSIDNAHDLGLRIQVSKEDGRTWTVRPIDISLGGVKVDFPEEELPELSLGSQFGVEIRLEKKVARLTGVIGRQKERRCSLFFREVYPEKGRIAEPPRGLREIIQVVEEFSLSPLIPKAAGTD